MRGKAFILLLAFLIAHAAAFAQEDPFDAMRDVVRHQETAVFEGVKVIGHWWGGNFTIQAVHIMKEQYHECFQYFPFGTHTYQEVVINGKNVYYIRPGKKLAYRAPFSFHGPKEEKILDLAARNYMWEDEGTETVAGEETRRIAATPLGGKNVTARFWVDEGHHVILREERYYENNGKLYFASCFSYITFPGDIDDAIFQVTPGYRLRDLPPPKELEGKEALKALDFTPLFPAFIPPGFEQVGTYLTRWRPHGKLNLLYSDGLRTFSVYENLRHGPYRAVKGSHIVFLSGHYVELLEWPSGNLVRFARGPLDIAVVGNLPEKSVARVALGIATPAAMRPPGPAHKVARYFIRGLRTLKRILLGFRP